MKLEKHQSVRKPSSIRLNEGSDSH